MRVALKRHPDTPCDAVERIDVEISRTGGLLLDYVAAGTIIGLRLPERAAPARADGLWNTTCFEAFLRVPGEAAYLEFNFSPSTQWAAYRFTDTRTGISIASDIATPRIAIRHDATAFALQAAFDPLRDAPWRLALSAVIEETNGRKSYWALAHPPGRPDFHHPDCFALEIPSASSAPLPKFVIRWGSH